MDSPPKMQVIDWEDSPPPIVLQTKARHRFLPPTLVGIFGTVLIHAILIQSVSFASRGAKPKPPESQESANALSKPTEDASYLVLISLPTIANATQASIESAIPSLPDMRKIKIKTPISVDAPELLNLETLALSEDQGSNSSAGGTDAAEKARLFGIYTGQIQARIDRVWKRPRTPINDDNSKNGEDIGDSFQCEAQIVQDIQGNVQEIMLPRCNGSPTWQHSLIAAIEQASPLPAPPSTSVFSHSVTLSFIGFSYVAGSSDDGYEVEARTVARE